MKWTNWQVDAAQLRRGATSKKAYSLLATTSFLESAILPISVDVIALPMMIGAPKKALTIANIALIASVFGGLAGYLIGYAFLETIGQWIISTYGLERAFAEFQQEADQNAWAAISAIFLGAVTPLPFKLVCLGAGVLKINLLLFIGAAFAGRALRFYAFALAFLLLGERLSDWAGQNLKAFGLIIVAVTILGFVLVAYWPNG
ncbi:YqaA family protein [Maritalea mediterranea]|uniref:VTT domain-containing protein n=1 Tax=Maritalea mediterranea TaxID=2909667 RepID=A0ABS9EA00_9HYPH|nr:VTT domain-containing protein [Maritalea mediterranea]MCF4098238.1 VTT domain-containing protein [Maritalea mediterranea]